MILLREVREADLDSLEALSKLAAEKHPGFLNIENDRDQWKEKVKRSKKSFSGVLKNKFDAKFIFVAEDTKSKKILGVSMVAAQHGTERSPHFYFDVDKEEKYSETIGTGFIHGTLKFRYDTNGPTEIGGLLVHPETRNSKQRIGRQISFARFLYIGLHKAKFKRRILAELLPPLTKKGKSPLWEAIGRRFTNMDYSEADKLSAKNKEFIFSLFPAGRIYTTFLPAEARNAIGKVSKDTEPVMHMLKKIGFKYRNQVDPFDGGPHLSTMVDDIIPIQKIKLGTYAGDLNDVLDNKLTQSGLVHQRNVPGFRAVHVDACIKANKIFFDKDAALLIGVKPGDQIAFMPYY